MQITRQPGRQPWARSGGQAAWNLPRVGRFRRVPSARAGARGVRARRGGGEGRGPSLPSPHRIPLTSGPRDPALQSEPHRLNSVALITCWRRCAVPHLRSAGSFGSFRGDWELIYISTSPLQLSYLLKPADLPGLSHSLSATDPISNLVSTRTPISGTPFHPSGKVPEHLWWASPHLPRLSPRFLRAASPPPLPPPPPAGSPISLKPLGWDPRSPPQPRPQVPAVGRRCTLETWEGVLCGVALPSSEETRPARRLEYPNYSPLQSAGTVPGAVPGAW